MQPDPTIPGFRQMGVRRFGRVNWLGLYTLARREIMVAVRFVADCAHAATAKNPISHGTHHPFQPVCFQSLQYNGGFARIVPRHFP